MRKRDELADPNSCMSRARDDEWTFVLLERDAAAPGTIRDWVNRRIALGKNKSGDAQMIEALEVANRMEMKDGDICRVITGHLTGASVVFHFVNSSGNLDCRFAENFGVYKKGDICVLLAKDVLRVAG